MLSKIEVIALLKKYKISYNIIKHSIGVADIVYKISSKIVIKNTKIGIDPNKVMIAGLLHNIGKSYNGIHEINTIKILKKEKLSDIANVSMHGFIYEDAILNKKNGNRFLPKSLENKILVLSDMYCNQYG